MKNLITLLSCLLLLSCGPSWRDEPKQFIVANGKTLSYHTYDCTFGVLYHDGLYETTLMADIDGNPIPCAHVTMTNRQFSALPDRAKQK